MAQGVSAVPQESWHIYYPLLKTSSSYVEIEKRQIAYIGHGKFLGYGFYPSKGFKIKLKVHRKSIEKMKSRVREITYRSRGISYETHKLELKQYVWGWVDYFKHADMKRLLELIDA